MKFAATANTTKAQRTIPKEEQYVFFAAFVVLLVSVCRVLAQEFERRRLKNFRFFFYQLTSCFALTTLHSIGRKTTL